MKEKHRQMISPQKAVEAYRKTQKEPVEPKEYGEVRETKKPGGKKTVKPKSNTMVTPITMLGASHGDKVEAVPPVTASIPLRRDPKTWITIQETETSGKKDGKKKPEGGVTDEA